MNGFYLIAGVVIFIFDESVPGSKSQIRERGREREREREEEEEEVEDDCIILLLFTENQLCFVCIAAIL